MLDAGPLIAFFYAKDTYHSYCVAVFSQLDASQTALLTPIPIIFEVYKWLLHHSYGNVARRALQIMNDKLQTVALEEQTFNNLQKILTDLPNWKGSLENATVVLTALQYDCPVWTYNYRDFSIFQSLEFWNPEDQLRD